MKQTNEFKKATFSEQESGSAGKSHVGEIRHRAGLHGGGFLIAETWPGVGWGVRKTGGHLLPKQLAVSERDNRGDAEDLIKRKVLERPHREETKSLLPARDPAVLLHHSADGISDRKNGKCSIDSRKPPTTNPASNSGPFTNSLFVWANPVTVTDSEILGRHLGRRHHHNHPQLRLHRRERAGDFWRSGAVLTPPDSFPTLRQGLIVRTLGLDWV